VTVLAVLEMDNLFLGSVDELIASEDTDEHVRVIVGKEVFESVRGELHLEPALVVHRSYTQEVLKFAPATPGLDPDVGERPLASGIAYLAVKGEDVLVAVVPRRVTGVGTRRIPGPARRLWRGVPAIAAAVGRPSGTGRCRMTVRSHVLLQARK
jgi:hypothetical protein